MAAIPPAEALALGARADAQPPGKPFLVGPRPLTYGELATRVGQAATLLAGGGLAPGARVLLATQADDAFVPLVLAMLRHGIVPMLMDPQATPHEAADLVARFAPDGVIVDEAQLGPWGLAAFGGYRLEVGQPAAPSLLGRLFKKAAATAGSTYPGVAAASPVAPLPPPPAADALAYVVFTSGTTSRPKGVEASHGGYLAHIATLARHFGYGPDARILNPLPLHHVDGLLNGLLVAYAAGATLVRPGPFSVPQLQRLADAVYRDRATHLVAVPTMLALLHRFAPGLEDAFATEDFRFVVSTAGRLDAHLWEAFEATFRTRVANCFGLTETGTGSLFSGPDDGTRRIGTIGKPVDCEVRVTDAAGADVPAGEAGELWIAGPHVMPGYHRDPEATAAVLRDGWLRTGDLVRRDADGFYHVVGRAKNVIVTGGRNVAPEEVAEALTTHPGVLDAVVLGVEDAAWGEAVVACVVPDPAGPPSAEDLAAHGRARLSPYKVPTRFVFMADLPRGPAGKVLIPEVRARLAAATTAGPGAEEDVEARVYAIAARAFQVPVASLGPASRPTATPGWTSLAHLALVVGLEEAFGIRLGVKDVITLETLADAAATVRRLRAARHG